MLKIKDNVDLKELEKFNFRDIGSCYKRPFLFGGYDGEHHKQWLIDQIVRILTKDDYKKWVERYEDGFEGKHTYEWDTGIAP